MAKEGRHVDTEGDCRVQNSAVGRNIIYLSEESASSSHVWGRDDEAVYGFLVREEQLFVGAGHEEEYI